LENERSDIMKIGKVIQLIREKKGINQKELADKINISYSVMNRIESGERPVRDEEIKNIANVLDVSTDYLLGAENRTTETKKGVKIPVLGSISAGVPIEAVTDIIDYEEITEEMANQGEHFALQINGDSMEPKFSQGDVVIVRKQPTVESGEIGIVLVNGHDATIKKIEKSEKGIYIIPTNNKYSPKFFNNEDIQELPVLILGRVIELRAKF